MQGEPRFEPSMALHGVPECDRQVMWVEGEVETKSTVVVVVKESTVCEESESPPCAIR